MRARWALLFVMLAAVGCLAQPVPALVAVADVSPRELDVGDRLDVLGGGFPEGRRATLSLRGNLHRPGQRATEDVEVVLAAESVAEDRIQAAVSEELQAELCGRGADADHTTFRGELVVAFAPRTSGAPPVTGTLAGVVLDLRPAPVSPEVTGARTAEAARLLGFLGLTVRGGQTGLEVVSVRGGGRAASAGLLSGDLIVAADDVTARAATDLVPSGRSRTATLVVRRGRLETPLRLSIDVAGFRNVLPDGLVSGVLIAVITLVVLLVLVGPLARLTTRFERRIAARLRRSVESFSPEPRSWPQGLAASRLLAYLAFVAQGFALTYLAFGGYLVSRELDVPVMFLVMATVLVALELCRGGFTEAKRWSLRRGASAAVRRIGVELCAAAAIACAALSAGGAALGDALRQQGGVPWRWAASESPVLAAAFVVLVASAGSLAPRPAHPVTGSVERATHGALTLAHWGNALFVAALAAALFLGGWRVPGISPTDPSIFMRSLGACFFLVKTWTVLAVILGLRWVAPRNVFATGEVLYRLRWMLPIAMLSLGAIAVIELGSVPPLPGALRDALGPVTTAAVLAFGAGVIARIALSLRSKAAQLNVNPWL